MHRPRSPKEANGKCRRSLKWLSQAQRLRQEELPPLRCRGLSQSILFRCRSQMGFMTARRVWCLPLRLLRKNQRQGSEKVRRAWCGNQRRVLQVSVLNCGEHPRAMRRILE